MKLNVPLKIENDLQSKINNITKKYTKPNFWTSMSYLLRDIIASAMVYITTKILSNYLNSTILAIFYSITAGTVWIGLWVLAHECGHGAFGHGIQNDIIGFILHSFLLVGTTCSYNSPSTLLQLEV